MVYTIIGVYFELKGERYVNNSMVNILAIGEGDNALLCKTNKQDCCGTVPNRFGEFSILTELVFQSTVLGRASIEIGTIK